jgi:hypothetical protein
MAATMRLQVVEDEQRLAAGLRKGLEAEGFAVDVVHNGTDGIWMARENPFDAIILDVMLPGANGYQVCRTLRNGIGVHSSDRCHCVTSWPKGVAELNGSSAASYRRNRAINAQYKCGKTTLLMISVRSFVTGRSSTRPSRSESHTRFSPILRVIHGSALSRLREVVGDHPPSPRSRR